MEDRIISQNQLKEYEKNLLREEKSRMTIQKYLRDVQKFMAYVGGRSLTKELTLDYKKKLEEEKH